MSVATIDVGQSIAPLFSIKDPFVMVEGPRGTGKTRGILSVLMCRAMEWPGARFLLARSTRTRLTDTVLVTLEQQVFPAFGIPIPGGAGRANRHDYTLPNGSVFIPMGLDDESRTQSLEVAGIYLAEATELQTVDEVTALAGSMRQAGFPFYQAIVDCNPVAPGNWMNQKAEPIDKYLRVVRTREDYERLQRYNRSPASNPQDRWKRLVTKHQDNPAYWDHEAWDYTPMGKQYVKTTLESLSGHLRRRWLDGDWIAAEGSVFPDFSEERHVVPPRDTIPGDWPCYVGIDPGFDHPCAILWLSVAPNGTYYIFDELYRGGLSIAQHADDIKARNAGRNMQGYYGDPQHCFSRTAQSPKTIASQFAEKGLRVAPWPRSVDKQAMVERVRQLIQADKLKVVSTCTNTIREFQSWAFKRTATGELPAGDDAYEDRNNHAMDVVCGLVACNLGNRGERVKAY